MDPRYRIVVAEPAHLAQIAEVERAAASIFAVGDLSPEILAETSDLEELEEARQAGFLFVALDTANADAVVGFAHVEQLGEGAHLEELDVHPAHGKRGIGRALVERVASEAQARGLPSVTLTTFTHVPWNAPFYRSAGFVDLPLDGLPEALAQRRRNEGARGLGPERRTVMRRTL